VAPLGQAREGPAEAIFSHPRHPYTQALFAAAFDLRSETVADPVPA